MQRPALQFVTARRRWVSRTLLQQFLWASTLASAQRTSGSPIPERQSRKSSHQVPPSGWRHERHPETAVTVPSFFVTAALLSRPAVCILSGVQDGHLAHLKEDRMKLRMLAVAAGFALLPVIAGAQTTAD